MKPGEQGKRSHERDRRRDRVDRAAKAVPALDGECERKHAQICGQAPDLRSASLGAFRPPDSERRPGAERGQEPERDPPRWMDPGEGKNAHQRAQEDQPPGGQPDLAVHDDVVAAPLEGEIEDEGERQHPAREHRAKRAGALAQPPEIDHSPSELSTPRSAFRTRTRFHVLI